MEIKKKVNGKEIGFRFSALTLELFSEKMNCEFSETFTLFKDKPLTAINDFLWCANAVYNRGEWMNRFEFYEIVDDMDQDDFQAIWDAFEKDIPRLIGKFTKKNKEAS